MLQGYLFTIDNCSVPVGYGHDHGRPVYTTRVRLSACPDALQIDDVAALGGPDLIAILPNELRPAD